MIKNQSGKIFSCKIEINEICTSIYELFLVLLAVVNLFS